ncbi:hypothetical protein, conserved [Eimeria praecox]|uniref:Uncharacterized protein n=1 Tax=Eimeria praecox TaxID=51316 RepID=U6GME9_9EIME|nr:hypothetical protein, conserved [Eimeria praecox]
MGSQCSRSSPGTPTRGLLMRVGSVDRDPRDRVAPPPFSSSSSSPCEDSDCDSIGSGPLSSDESGPLSEVAPLESPLPWMVNESCFSASLWHAPNPQARSFETTLGNSSDTGLRTRGHVVSDVKPPATDPKAKLDEPTRKMFLEFYHRNRKEQKRHEHLLKAASRVVDHSFASCPAFVSAVSLETIQEKSPRSPVPADILARQEAEALAVEALDVFSPDEKYTRLDEFLALVNAIQSEYRSERHRGRAIRGPNRASTFGVLRTPPERD